MSLLCVGQWFIIDLKDFEWTVLVPYFVKNTFNIIYSSHSYFGGAAWSTAVVCQLGARVI